MRRRGSHIGNDLFRDGRAWGCEVEEGLDLHETVVNRTVGLVVLNWILRAARVVVGMTHAQVGAQDQDPEHPDGLSYRAPHAVRPEAVQKV